MTKHAARLWRVGVLLRAIAACSSSANHNAPPEAATICAPGQASQCHCADGTPPSSTGCAGAPSDAGNRATAGADAPSTAHGGAGIGRAGDVIGTQAESGAGGNASVTSAAGASVAAPEVGGGGAPASAGNGGAAQPGGSGGSSSNGTDAGSAGTAAGTIGIASVADCGNDASVGKDKNAAGPGGMGRHPTGSIDFTAKAGNRFVRLQTTLEVPAKPNGNSTLFTWPGLEPIQGTSMNFDPIGRGVLQPVLTWGTSCTPSPPTDYTKWWISGMYVNISTAAAGPSGCAGGKSMNVDVGDKLYIDMRLKAGTTTWSQTVTNLSNNKSVDFDMDLQGQDQNWALFEIEVASSTLPSSDVIFTDSVLTLATSEPDACQPSSHGPNDYFSAPLISADGTKCCIARLVLREQGVPPTTTDP